MKNLRGWILATAVAATVIGCGDNHEPPIDASIVRVDAGQSPVQRGRYIMNTLGACTFCHTPLNPDGSRDLTRLLAGWNCDTEPLPFFDIDPANANVGCLSTRNLTNHETGLKNKTDQQIKDAIKLGKRTDDKSLVPVMPYYIFHNMTDDDLDAIVAYLRTVPGVDNLIPPNQEPWLSINNGTTVAAPYPLTDIPMPGPGADQASAMRGRYLSSMVGLCIDCHTPDKAGMALFPQPIETTKSWAGGRVFPKETLGLFDPAYPNTVTTRNLTQDATGLMGWNKAQIKAAIADGKDKDGNAVCAGTHGSFISPYAALMPQDLDDIAEYIASLPGVVNDTGADCAGPPVP